MSEGSPRVADEGAPCTLGGIVALSLPRWSYAEVSFPPRLREAKCTVRGEAPYVREREREREIRGGGRPVRTKRLPATHQ